MATGLPITGIVRPSGDDLPIYDPILELAGIPDLVGVWAPDADYVVRDSGGVSSIASQYGDIDLLPLLTGRPSFVEHDAMLDESALRFAAANNALLRGIPVASFWGWTAILLLRPSTADLTTNYHLKAYAALESGSYEISWRTTATGGHAAVKSTTIPVTPQLGTGAGTINLGKYSTLIYRATPDAVSVFKDGGKTEFAGAMPAPDGPTLLYLGGRPNAAGTASSGSYDGLLGAAVVYGRALTDAEVAQAYRAIRDMHPGAVPGTF
ncbi:hypothetical protein [Paracoccus sp. (in: a-proteobacteria)]|uniref:hypothetical protein n=1 Tax=Paracoccus sp. TaxID=267 RepID=UPI00289E19D2|nr:hypothetical protein [Paracoccus sp. (in: a-proteobacteria)]